MSITRHRPWIVWVALGMLPTLATATDECPEYFEAQIQIARRAKNDMILSYSKATYYNRMGSVSSDTYTYGHYIVENGRSVWVATDDIAGTYEGTIEYQGIQTACYRGRLLTVVGCASIDIRSSETCVPESEPPPDGVPETQPGDGTGDGPDPRPSTPIVIDLGGDGFRFTSYVGGAAFDLNADGFRGWTAWTDSDGDEAFLALDRNSNGVIDSGVELFGDHTPQPPSASPNGFDALALYDQPEWGGNGDGLISAADLIFPRLLLWRDSNHDGASQPEEIQPLSAASIRAIDLDYILSMRRDRHGNQLRWASRVERFHGWTLGATDVIFAVE